MSLFNTVIPSFARAPVARGENNAGNPRPAIKPVYQVKGADDAFAVTVFLPGVAKDGLELTASDTEFRVLGRRAWQQPADWTVLHRESALVPFELVLTHDRAIDVGKVAAELRDGVLRVSLPKHEAVKPHKITVS